MTRPSANPIAVNMENVLVTFLLNADASLDGLVQIAQLATVHTIAITEERVIRPLAPVTAPPNTTAATAPTPPLGTSTCVDVKHELTAATMAFA